MLELVDFICITGWSDVEPRNLPLFESEEGNPKIGIVDLEEFSERTTLGLLGSEFRSGLLKCCVTVNQAKQVYARIEKTLKGKGIWAENEKNADGVLKAVCESIKEKERLASVYKG